MPPQATGSGPSNGFGSPGAGGFTSQPSPGTGSFGGFGGSGPSPVIPPAPTQTNGNGGHGSNGADNGVRVPAPPENGHEQRLPIFDSLESDWFRRSGTTHATTQAAASGTGTGTGEEPAWHSSPADEGWRAAETVAAPSTGDTTTAGLPRRVPRANLVPGSVGEPGAAPDDSSGGAPSRSAEEVRNRLASFQRGVREARASAPKTEEP